jgi:hypothetical protein
MKTLSKILFLMILSSAAFARDLYVSNGGDDRSLGTITHPWATIDKVEKSARAGDKIFLHRGSKWTTQFNLPSSNLVIDAYGDGASPVIDGSSLYFSIALTDRSATTIRNIKLLNAANDCIRIEQKVKTTHDILIENNTIIGCKVNGINFAPSNTDIAAGRMPYNIRVLNNNIRNCGNAAVQVRAQADVGDNRIAYNIIDNVGTKDATNAISICYVHNLIVEHNTITNTRSTDIDGSGITADYLNISGNNLYGSGTVIRDNNIECPSPPINDVQAGIAIWRQPNVKIYNNTVKRCNEGIRVSGDVSTGYDIHHNTIISAFKRGASFTTSAAGGQFHHNTLSGTNHGDVSIWISRGSSVPAENNNIIRNFSTDLYDGNESVSGLDRTDSH